MQVILAGRKLTLLCHFACVKSCLTTHCLYTDLPQVYESLSCWPGTLAPMVVPATCGSWLGRESVLLARQGVSLAGWAGSQSQGAGQGVSLAG